MSRRFIGANVLLLLAMLVQRVLIDLDNRAYLKFRLGRQIDWNRGGLLLLRLRLGMTCGDDACAVRTDHGRGDGYVVRHVGSFNAFTTLLNSGRCVSGAASGPHAFVHTGRRSDHLVHRTGTATASPHELAVTARFDDGYSVNIGDHMQNVLVGRDGTTATATFASRTGTATSIAEIARSVQLIYTVNDVATTTGVAGTASTVTFTTATELDIFNVYLSLARGRSVASSDTGRT